MCKVSDVHQIIPNPETADQLGTWVKAFLVDRQAAGLSARTVSYYQEKLTNFVTYCTGQSIQRMDQLSPTTLRGYLLQLEKDGHNSGGIHSFYRSVRAFLRWYEAECEPEGWRNPIKKVKGPKVPEEVIEPVELSTVEALVEVCDKSFCGLRDKALVYFLLDTGARAGEVCALNLADIDPISGSVLIRMGKGRKPRTVFCGRVTRRAVRAYVKARPNEADAALWVTDEGERITYSGLRAIVRRLSERAKVETPSLHDFRRGFALQCLRNGMDVYSLQKLMGHVDLQVLRRYLAQTDEDLQAAHQQNSPVDRMVDHLSE